MRQPPDGDGTARPPTEPDDTTVGGEAAPSADDEVWAAPTDPPATGTGTPPIPVELTPVPLASGAPGSAPPQYDPPESGQAIPGQFDSGPLHPPIGLVAPPRKRRGLLIAPIALVATLLLCVIGGVSAFLVLRGAELGEGATDPVTAVDRLLTAVYTERDADRAASLVCPAARDDGKIATKIQEIADSVAAYDNPRFRWITPEVDEQTGERALVSTTLTMATGDERMVDQRLAFIVVEETGWWVCDVV